MTEEEEKALPTTPPNSAKSKTFKLAQEVELLDSRSRVRKKPAKYNDYEYAGGEDEEQQHSYGSDYEEEEERIIKRKRKLQR